MIMSIIPGSLSALGIKKVRKDLIGSWQKLNLNKLR